MVNVMPAAGHTSTAEVVSCPECGRRNRVRSALAGTPHCADCHQPLPWITRATDHDFADIVTESTLPVLVHLWAPWSWPSRAVAHGVRKAAHAYAGHLKVVEVNVDQSPETAHRYQARAVPTLLLLDDGQVRARRAGAGAALALLEWVGQALTRPVAR
ncbi:thioredoxin domain-containing protein [Catellatospora sp. NPDC049609]|uniref:thioredoxin family protein n=1 Tax=Catellatospora sp. NPDC049609 TaxID=3155505 RepID=UPI003429DA38